MAMRLIAAFVAVVLSLSGVAAQPAFNTTGGYGNPTIQSPGSASSVPPAWALHALHPLDVGTLGSYAKTLTSGTMAAGLAANAPVYSFRYGGPGVAVIRRVRVSARIAGTAFTAGLGKLELFPARSFTASDTGGTAGTLTGNNGKLRTSFGTTGVADIRISSTGTLTAGTRTLDTDPVAGGVIDVPPTVTNGQLVTPYSVVYEPKVGEYPLALATNEGFVIQATVPATGTWNFSITVEWDELPAF